MKQVVTPFSVFGKKTLITGASGGIGAAIAREFYHAGAEIVISGTRENVLNDLKNTLEQEAKSKGENPTPIHVMTCNLSEKAEVENLIKEASSRMGSLDVLVNNGGITKDGLLMRMKDEDWDRVLAVNLTSCFQACRAAIKPMMSQKKGRIINMASIVGVTGNPGQTNYCASKAGMIGFTKALAQEVATRGITVNCIAPGFIASPMTDVLQDNVKDTLLKNIPMQRMGTPEDIAAAALFLASDGASYMTGQTLHVNGGMSMI